VARRAVAVAPITDRDRDWGRAMDPDAVLDGLDPEQRAVARAVRGPVCVLAGAGTGKTRAITHRIAYAVLSGVIAPQRVLAVTFTTRAAGELRGRLRRLGAPGVQARTFHSAALRQLTFFWPRVVGGEPPRIIESKFGLVTEAARSCPRSLGRPELRDVSAEIEWSKANQIRPGDYPAAAAGAGRRPPLDLVDMARLYETYETLRRERNQLDFEGLLELTAAMICEHAEVAEAVRDQYRYFVVDEFQDVNPLQQLLLDAWLGERDDVCVVGDPNQTIYSFTGATPSYLLGFTARHPGAMLVRLVRDYRSTPQVVRLANGLLARAGTAGTAGTAGAGAADAAGVAGTTVAAGATGTAGAAGAATASRPAVPRLELIAQRPDGQPPVFTEHDDEISEARDVAGHVKKLLASGVPASEIAVLFRVNAQSETYEQALADAQIPYLVRGGERFFDRPEVRQAIVLLRGAVRSADDTGGAGVADDAGARPLVTTVRHILSSAGFTERPPAGGGAARERWESLSALVQLAETMTAGRAVNAPAGDNAEPPAAGAAEHSVGSAAESVAARAAESVADSAAESVAGRAAEPAAGSAAESAAGCTAEPFAGSPAGRAAGPASEHAEPFGPPGAGDAAVIAAAPAGSTGPSAPAGESMPAGSASDGSAGRSRTATLAAFVAELEERAAAQHAPPLDGVTLASLHAAKGLEWEAVFLVGLVEGTLPIVYAETPAQLEEERRLLYVGVTRARSRLFLSWALARSPGGRRGRRRSRFLHGLAPQTSQTSTPPRHERATGPRRSGPVPCRICGRPLMASIERKLGRCEGCPADYDEGLLAALKAWRLETARTQSVPAFVVFTDATLQAIAERRPTSASELSAIPGVGSAKVDRFGEAVLALSRGEAPVVLQAGSEAVSETIPSRAKSKQRPES
jgi:DNA helicase-2/ATP-dependent DNA helicase PcrA